MREKVERVEKFRRLLFGSETTESELLMDLSETGKAEGGEKKSSLFFSKPWRSKINTSPTW
jgi:hypothetical protein